MILFFSFSSLVARLLVRPCGVAWLGALWRLLCVPYGVFGEAERAETAATRWWGFRNVRLARPRGGGGFRTLLLLLRAVLSVSERSFGSATRWCRFPLVCWGPPRGGGGGGASRWAAGGVGDEYLGHIATVFYWFLFLVFIFGDLGVSGFSEIRSALPEGVVRVVGPRVRGRRGRGRGR